MIDLNHISDNTVIHCSIDTTSYFQPKCQPIYRRATKPKMAAPATPLNAVGRAAAALLVLELAAEPVAEPVAEPAAEAAEELTELRAEDAADAAELARLVALLIPLPASLVMLARMDVAAELREDRVAAAPVLPEEASELRLERSLESEACAELKLAAIED